MKKTKYLLVFALPLIFICGCIDGQAVLSINKDGSGKVTFEGLFDYPAYSAAVAENYTEVKPFFLDQIKKMLTSGGFEAWDNVAWKFLDDGRCYFKGTAYFEDINKIDFFIGSVKSDLKLLYQTNEQQKPVLELKYAAEDNAPEKQQIKSLPPVLFKTFSINLVITLPADIEETEKFQLVDSQTAMFLLSGNEPLESLKKDAVKIILVSTGRNLFDYKAQAHRAQKEYEKVLKSLQISQMAEGAADWLGKNNQNDKSFPTKTDLKNDFNAQLRQGLVAEAQNDFQQVFNIYQNIIDDVNADEKYKAAASYQVGVCLLKTNDKEQAVAQFEYVLDNYPQQHAVVLKSVKMLRDIRSGKVDKKIQKQRQPPFVVGTIPELFAEDVDPNTSSITIAFSEPMEKADWFYSSFEPALLPRLADRPFFDESGYEWTLPIELKAGKVYAIAINCGDAAKGIKNLQAGFRSVSGQWCENFVLVFATADKQRLPTPIDDGIIERCEKINFEPEK